MNRRTVVLVVFLVALPLALISYRIALLGYPFFPTLSEKVWLLVMEARVRDSGEGVKVVIGLPSRDKRSLIMLEETATGGSLDFSISSDGQNRVGTWAGAAGHEGVPISYRATLVIRPGNSIESPLVAPERYSEEVSGPEQALAGRLVSYAMILPPPARLRAVADLAAGAGDQSRHTPGDRETWAALDKRLGREKALLMLLRAAGLRTRVSEGLTLEEGATSKTRRWIEAWTGSEWQSVQPETGAGHHKAISFLPLAWGGMSAVRAASGEVSDIRWSLARQIVSQWRLHFERIRQSDHLLDRWSLFSLPPEYQGTFRILILVPLGALLICILRNFVGFPTFGIFMPVLMALAFRNTGLTYGLGVFAAVVLIGFSARKAIDKLRLLLVPRLSLILTLVIACFIFFALAGNKIGLREMMAVGLLPFVILTMTIERFYIIVEEQGTEEGLRTAAGSAVVATITYGIIHIEPLQLAFFLYPELLSLVAAAQVLLGRYTGYRLLELFRFRRFRVGHDR